MKRDRKKYRRGITLLDIILILMTIAIMVVGGMGFYSSLIQQRMDAERRFMAANLAKAQIEDLMPLDFGDGALNPGNNPAPTIAIPPEMVTFDVDYFVTDYSAQPSPIVISGNQIPYKELRVTVDDTARANIPDTVIVGYKIQ